MRQKRKVFNINFNFMYICTYVCSILEDCYDVLKILSFIMWYYLCYVLKMHMHIIIFYGMCYDSSMLLRNFFPLTFFLQLPRKLPPQWVLGSLHLPLRKPQPRSLRRRKTWCSKSLQPHFNRWCWKALCLCC